MTPPTRVAWGLLLVIFDLRIDGLDLIPDLFGWALVVWGVAPLRGRSDWFDLALVGGVVGALVSVPVLVAVPGPVLATVEVLAQTALVFGTCSGIRAIAGQESVARTANLLRWTDLALTCVLLGSSAALRFRPTETLWAIPLAVLTMGVLIWFLVFLFTLKGHPTLQERQLVA